MIRNRRRTDVLPERAPRWPSSPPRVRRLPTGGRALALGGRYVVVAAGDAEWLEGFGSAFAYLHELHGRIVSIPINP